MKNFGIAVLLLALFCCGCASEFRRYENENYGFSLLLPAGWEIEEGFRESIVLAKAPEKNPVFRSSINLTIANVQPIEARLGRKLSLTEYYEVGKAQLFEVMPGIKSNVTEDTVVASENAGLLLHFDDKVPDSQLELTFLVAVWIIKGNIYTLTCSTEKEKFKKYLPIFEKALKSLRVK